MMFYGNGGWSFWQVALMSVGMIGFWGLLIGLFVWLVRGSGSGSGSGTDSDRVSRSLPARGADEVLAERFARGDINDEEFTRRRQLLHSTPAQSS